MCVAQILCHAYKQADICHFLNPHFSGQHFAIWGDGSLPSCARILSRLREYFLCGVDKSTSLNMHGVNTQ